MAVILLSQIVVFVIMNGLMISASPSESSIENSTPMLQTSPHATVHDLDTVEQGSGRINDEADELVNDMMEGFANLRNENVGKESDQKSSDSDSYDYDAFNCSLPATVDRYCPDFPGQYRIYFKNDLSVSGILASLFKKEVVEDLRSSCPPLNWCLIDSFHQFLMQGKAQFYSANPFCSDYTWSCLEAMQEERTACDDYMQMNFLLTAADLLCSLEEVGKLTMTEECYASTMQALYVTYVDMSNPAGSASPYDQAGCNVNKVQMTTTFLCAYDACGPQQRSLLQSFEFWKEVAMAANETAALCMITRTCKPSNTSVEPSNSYVDYDSIPETNPGSEANTDSSFYDEVEEILEEIAKEAEDVISQEESQPTDDSPPDESMADGVNTNTVGAKDDNNKAFMFGLIVMAAVLVLGALGLAFLGYRQFCHSKCGRDRWGYSKLLDDESKLLRAEYS